MNCVKTKLHNYFVYQRSNSKTMSKYEYFPNVLYPVPVITDDPKSFYKLCDSQVFYKQNSKVCLNCMRTSRPDEICSHKYEDICRYSKTILIYKIGEDAKNFNVTDFVKQKYKGLSTEPEYLTYMNNDLLPVISPSFDSVLVISKEQIVDETVVEIMKHFKAVIFTNYSGRLTEKIPPNVEIVIIFSNKPNNILEMLQDGVKYIYIHEFYYDDDSDDKEANLNSSTISVNINHLPDSILLIDINTKVQTITRFPLNTQFLIFNIYASVETDLEVFPPNLIMFSNESEKIRNYKGFNKLKTFFNTYNSYIPSDLPDGLENFYHLGELVFEDFKKIPQSVKHMIMKCDLYGKAVELPLCLEGLHQDMNGFVFVNEYPPNLKFIEINISYMKYVDISKLPKSMEKFLFIEEESPSFETDDEFYENKYGINLRELRNSNDNQDDDCESTHEIPKDSECKRTCKANKVDSPRKYGPYESMDHLVPDDEVIYKRHKELKAKVRHQYRESIFAELTKRGIEYDVEGW